MFFAVLCDFFLLVKIDFLGFSLNRFFYYRNDWSIIDDWFPISIKIWNRVHLSTLEIDFPIHATYSKIILFFIERDSKIEITIFYYYFKIQARIDDDCIQQN